MGLKKHNKVLKWVFSGALLGTGGFLLSRVREFVFLGVFSRCSRFGEEITFRATREK